MSQFGHRLVEAGSLSARHGRDQAARLGETARVTSGVPVLLLTGTIGAGKTAVAMEINDVLAEMKIPNAALDLDALTAHWPPSSKWNADLMFDNLALLWPSYQAHGATRLVLAHVLENGSELMRYREAIPGADITVVRLVARSTTREQRIRARMPAGPSRDWHLQRTYELEEILDRVTHEDFTVENDDRAIRIVATEVLRRAAWIPDDGLAGP